MKYFVFLSIPALFACGTLASVSTANSAPNPNLPHMDAAFAATAPAPKDTLKRAASFPIGVGIGGRQLADPQIRQLVSKEFNAMSTASTIFWAQISPQPNTFLFGPADALVNFGVANGMRVHGHCLINFQGTPDWVQNFQGDSAAWENLMKTHIQTIVSHFRGRVSSWDVVNEAFDDNGKQWTQELNQVTKKTDINVWRLHLGDDYIARAFIYAHEADPNAVLFYNDYGQERLPKKLKAIVHMVNNFKARHIPIGGVGLQMHIKVDAPQAGIMDALYQLSNTGVQVRISELDIRLNLTYKPHDPDSLQNVDRQKNLFYAVARMYSTVVPKSQQYGITFWCATAKDTYINANTKVQDDPLLFDRNYARKPAYEAFVAGLHSGK